MLNLPMDHIGLHCSDVELNAKWYQEELGFKVAGKFPGMGGRNVYFLENPQDGKMYEISQRDQLPGEQQQGLIISHTAHLTSKKIMNIVKKMDIRLYLMGLRQV
ncbi:MAG: VOC family protein [Anaerostipes sp.]